MTANMNIITSRKTNKIPLTTTFITKQCLRSIWQIDLTRVYFETFYIGNLFCVNIEEHSETHILPKGTLKLVTFGVGVVCVSVGVRGVQSISPSVLAK